jgi:hypothetical protein
VKVGDMIKFTYSNAYWTGLIVELLEGAWAIIWRPDRGFQTWSLDQENSHYQIEVINES